MKINYYYYHYCYYKDERKAPSYLNTGRNVNYNLGVIFDPDLSFNSLLKQISRTAFFHLRNISKIRNVLTQKDAEKLVHAFVTSRLDYCNSLLSGSSRKSLKTLQLVQNAAARVLTRTKKREHITPVLASLHWLPVKSRIEFKILLLTFKALNNMAPLYFKELIVPNQPTRALRSQNSGLLVVPKVSKSRVGARALSYQALSRLPTFISIKVGSVPYPSAATSSVNNGIILTCVLYNLPRPTLWISLGSMMRTSMSTMKISSKS